MRNKNHLTIVVHPDHVDYLPTRRRKRPPANFKIWLQGGLTVFICVIIIFTVVKAGSLTPPSTPASPAQTGYTLGDIYTRLTTNATSTEGGHAFTPSGSPTSTLYSLTDIYNSIPSIDPGKVATSTRYLGITGTLLGNMWNGTCSNPESCTSGNEISGGTQAQGGVDDCNGNSDCHNPPAGRYATAWTQCNDMAYNAATNPGGNRCNTGDPGADAKDEATGLIWSYPCHDTGCSSWDQRGAPDDSNNCLNGGCAYYNDDSYYTWDNSGNNGGLNDGKDAYTLCSQIHTISGHDYTGWSLPHQKQLMQAYIDGAYGNLEPLGVSRYYWSATTDSGLSSYAWYVYLSYGITYSNGKSSTFYVRCVRPAM